MAKDREVKTLDANTFDYFVFQSGLYTNMKLPNDDAVIYHKFKSDYSKRLYCPYCNEFSIFKFSKVNIDRAATTIQNYSNFLHSTGSVTHSNNYVITNLGTTINFSNLVFDCALNQSHHLYFYFLTQGDNIIKVGQYPSVADMQFPQMSKYNNQLKEFAKEFRTSIGLFSHGVGIGSFVYLRRIFEFIIEAVHNSIKNTSNWDEEEYIKLSKLEQKIEACEKYYPIFPEEIKQYKMQIYGVLSKGIHSLDEEECLRLYPALQYLIENIMDFEIEKRGKELKLKEAIKNLSSFG